MRRVQLVIDADLHEQAKQQAERLGTSFSALVREALQAHLTKGIDVDLSWVGMLGAHIPDDVSHDWDDIRESIAQGAAERFKTELPEAC